MSFMYGGLIMFEYDFMVQYVDINTSGVLSDYGLLKYLQEIACLHADSKKYGLKDTPVNRLAWIILDWRIEFISRPNWNTKLHIKTWASKIDNISCYRDFEVTSESGERLALASSRWVLLNIDTHHISKITPEIKSAFEPICSSVFTTETNKLTEPDSYESCFEYTILKRDIDTNQHLNNLNYIMLAKEALPEANEFSKIDVMYKHQCLLSDKVLFLCHKEDCGYVVAVKNADTGVLHAIISFAL